MAFFQTVQDFVTWKTEIVFQKLRGHGRQPRLRAWVLSLAISVRARYMR